MCGVYLIKNLLTKKRYIGGTSGYHERIMTHFSALRRNKHANTGMQEDFNRYGEKSFVCGLIKKTADIYTEEKRYIDRWHPEYNIRNLLPLPNIKRWFKKNHPMLTHPESVKIIQEENK